MDDDVFAKPARARVLGGLDEIDRDVWDGLANPSDLPYSPFLSWDFLEAVEHTQCACIETGWAPRHLILENEAGDALAAAPLYLKSHSQGEYVFDHSWADAFERAGGRYYPKLLCAVPFTPVPGRRLLAPTPSLRASLLDAIASAARQFGVSSAHVNFIEAEDWELAGAHDYLQRTDQQFMWRNEGYESFDDFLASLASRKRKALRKERAAAQDGVDIVHLSGDELTEEHWDAFFEFYLNTGARKWGSPYLNREFFALLHERLREKCLMVMARSDGRWIAGALHLIGGDALYGRYWGRVEERPFLHFELCYYQAIDIAIERGLARVEAGAQGSHKMARGYIPTPTYSAHWIANPGLRAALEDYLERERDAVAYEIEALSEMTPFKKGGA